MRTPNPVRESSKVGRRGTVVLPVDVYTPQRKAEFLLNNAVTVKDYRRARAAVKAMGLNPDDIPHPKPTGS